MRVLFGLLLAASVAVSSTAFAATEIFDAKLSGRAESPPTTAAGKGVLTATVDTDTHVLSYKVSYTGLSGPATMAHFHGPAKGGQNAPPIIVVADPSTPISGHARLSAAQLSDLEKGLWYFNVHTAANPGGEIRGQVRRRVDEEQLESAPGTGVDLSDVCGRDHPCLGQ